MQAPEMEEVDDIELNAARRAILFIETLLHVPSYQTFGPLSFSKKIPSKPLIK